MVKKVLLKKMIDLKIIEKSGVNYSDWLDKHWPKSFNGESYAKDNLISCLREIEEGSKCKDETIIQLKIENKNLNDEKNDLILKVKKIEIINFNYENNLSEKDLEIEKLKNQILQLNLNNNFISDYESDYEQITNESFEI